MKHCPQCRRPQESGRFCSACGAALEASPPAPDPLTDPLPDSPDDLDPAVTRVRGIPPVPPAPAPLPGPTGPPPAAPPLPPLGARYPLFADEVADGVDADSAPPPASPPGPTVPPPAEPPPAAGAVAHPDPAQGFPEDTARDSSQDSAPEEERPGEETFVAGPLSFAAPPRDGAGPAGDERRTSWVVWAVVGLLCVVMLLLGLWLLFAGDGEESANATDTASAAAHESPPATSSASDPSPAAPRSALGGEARDVAGSAQASAPSTAPSGTDVDGNTVNYAAANLVDGDVHSAWRMAGDGTGTVLTFQLDTPTTITEAGLVNGYDKTSRQGDRTLDWYAGNRRVLAVEWEFDDGTTLRQDFGDDRSMQTIEVPEHTTETVKLRLLQVSGPGAGPAARDYTALSEVSLTGRTG